MIVDLMTASDDDDDLVVRLTLETHASTIGQIPLLTLQPWRDFPKSFERFHLHLHALTTLATTNRQPFAHVACG